MNGLVGPKHICFYSNRCEWSKAFLSELSQTPYKGDFTYICVDSSPTRPSLPPWLKKVPTLVISEEREPRTDGNVMNWLYEKKLSTPRSTTTPSDTVTAKNTEPDAFIFREMGNNYKDSYSFLDSDTSTSGNGGTTLMHNFEMLGGSSSTGSREGIPITSTGGSGKRSRKEEMFDSQMEAYKRDRESGVPKMATRM